MLSGLRARYLMFVMVNFFWGLASARDWVQFFVNWYNKEHFHSAIKFIIPEQCHASKDDEISMEY